MQLARQMCICIQVLMQISHRFNNPCCPSLSRLFKFLKHHMQWNICPTHPYFFSFSLYKVNYNLKNVEKCFKDNGGGKLETSPVLRQYCAQLAFALNTQIRFPKLTQTERIIHLNKMQQVHFHSRLTIQAMYTHIPGCKPSLSFQCFNQWIHGLWYD